MSLIEQLIILVFSKEVLTRIVELLLMKVIQKQYPLYRNNAMKKTIKQPE